MRSRFRRGVAIALGAFCAAAGTAPSMAQDAEGNWAEYHGDYRAWRYSPLDSINATNVGKLKVAWMHQAGDITSGLQATPLKVGNVVYYIGPNNRVYALDAVTGEQIWEYIHQLEDDANKSIFAHYNRGVTLGHDKVFFGTLDGFMVALDAKTGKEAWKTRLTVPQECHGCNFTSPPALGDGVLVIGKTGGDLAQMGELYGVDAETGKRLWTFEVPKKDPKSWPTEEARKRGGGGSWLPGQYDPDTRLLYISTSNPAPDMRGAERKGDNLYTSSILALDPKTGAIKWHHQEVPHDVWDFDAAAESVLFEKDGKKLMSHLNKGGFVTVLERDTGKVENVWQFAENVNWVDSIDPKTGALVGRVDPSDDEVKTFCPSALGARSWNHGAYSPKTGLYYSNGFELCNTIKTFKQDPKTLRYSQPYYDAELGFVPPPGKDGKGWLGAFDAYTGKVAWKVDYKNPGLNTVLVTGGDVVFNGDPDGHVYAYDAKSGKELWKFNTGSGLRGGIISYSAGSKQYVLVTSGFGSLFPAFASPVFKDFKNVRGGAVLIAFTLE